MSLRHASLLALLLTSAACHEADRGTPCALDRECPVCWACVSGRCTSNQAACSPAKPDAGPANTCIAGDALCTPECMATDVDCLLEQGLVAYWKMDESAGMTAFDASGNNHHLALGGNATRVPGDFGNAVQFDGVSAYGDTNLTQDLPQFTVSTWVFGDKAPVQGINTGPVMKQQNFMLSWDNEAAAVNVNGVRNTASFGNLITGHWYHLVATYDGTMLRTYVDGQLVTATGAAGSAEGSLWPLKVGRHAVNQWFFEGRVDETRIYDRALEDLEVQALHDYAAAYALAPAKAAGACAPLTCADQNKDCGLITDGCGKVLDCGPCALNTQTCVGSAVTNNELDAPYVCH